MPEKADLHTNHKTIDIMEPQGFCIIRADANFGSAMGQPKDWLGKIIMALEINELSQSVLCLTDGTFMGQFDFKDLETKFRCDKNGIYLFPPGLNITEQMAYQSIIMNRNGGYCDHLMKIVIMASLHRGEFCDSVLWQKGQHPSVIKSIARLKKIARERSKTTSK